MKLNIGNFWSLKKNSKMGKLKSDFIFVLLMQSWATNWNHNKQFVSSKRTAHYSLTTKIYWTISKEALKKLCCISQNSFLPTTEGVLLNISANDFQWNKHDPWNYFHSFFFSIKCLLLIVWNEHILVRIALNFLKFGCSFRVQHSC